MIAWPHGSVLKTRKPLHIRGYYFRQSILCEAGSVRHVQEVKDLVERLLLLPGAVTRRVGAGPRGLRAADDTKHKNKSHAWISKDVLSCE